MTFSPFLVIEELLPFGMASLYDATTNCGQIPNPFIIYNFVPVLSNSEIGALKLFTEGLPDLDELQKDNDAFHKSVCLLALFQ